MGAILFANGTLSLLILAAATLFYGCAPAAPLSITYKIALLDREKPEFDIAQQLKSERYNKLNRIIYEELVHRHNRGDHSFKLELLPASPSPKFPAGFHGLQPAEKNTLYGNFQAARYRELTTEKNLACVFDNGWGAEISLVRKEIHNFNLPVVLLNGDRNRLNYGNARLFVGSGDLIPSEITSMLPSLVQRLKRDDENARIQSLFVTEPEYKLTDTFRASLALIKGQSFGDWPEMALASDAPDSRGVVAIAKKEILLKLMGSLNWDEMQATPKVIVLNVHGHWGEVLLPWLNKVFKNLSVIGHQSIYPIHEDPLENIFTESGNELILLSNSDQSLPEEVVTLLRDLKKGYPDIFGKNEAAFFIHRNVVAFEACVRSIREAGADGSFEIKNKPRALSHAFAKIKGGSIQTEAGKAFFSEEGEWLNKNRFISIRNGYRTTHGFQLRHIRNEDASRSKPGSGNTRPDLVRNIHCGVSSIKISSVNITEGSFHASLDYWTIEPPNLDGEANGTLRESAEIIDSSRLIPNDFIPDQLADISIGAVGQRLRTSSRLEDGSRQRAYQISGRFNHVLNGKYFPFDKHRLNIELQSPSPDNCNTLSQHVSSLPVVAVEGWTPGLPFIGLASRDNSYVASLFPTSVSESSRYDAINIGVVLKRRIWDSILLIMVPLALLVGSSTGIFWIKFSQTADETSRFETLKTQTELSLGCILSLIAYLISYAQLVPRANLVVYSDYLVVLSLTIAVSNFIFLAAVKVRERNIVMHWLSLERFRRFSLAFFIFCFLGWFAIGIIHQAS